jgi:hypothetical protein
MADVSPSVDQLERQLTEQGHLLDDPLSLHESLISAYLAAHNNSKYVMALERCTQLFFSDKRYKNDIRYLRIWLTYARHCKQPRDIFDFLEAHGVGKELAIFYEEWAKVLVASGEVERSRAVLEKGIAAGAQPLERLKRTFTEFSHKNPSNKRSSWENGQSISWTTTSTAAAPTTTKGLKEVKFYDPLVIDNGAISFEQARARYYFKQKQLNNPTKQAIAADDLPEDDEEVPGLSQPINPDDLTHISVYKDNTGDVRELTKLLNSNNNNMKAVDDFVLSRIKELGDIPHSDTNLLSRLSAIKLSQNGRNDDGRTATISAIKTNIGHFFLEGKLGENEFLAVDVGSSDLDGDSSKYVLQVIGGENFWPAGAYEAIILREQLKVALKLGRYNDCLIVLRPHNSGGTLEQLIRRKYQFEPLLGLYFVKELLRGIVSLHEIGLYHGNLTLANVHLSFAIPKRGSLILTGHKPVHLLRGTTAARESDLNGVQSVCSAIYQSTKAKEASDEWRLLIGCFQRKSDLSVIIEKIEAIGFNQSGKPTLKSMLIALETDVIRHTG